MLEVRKLCKRFAGIPAVDNVSFQARPGSITGYLGPNGSGKSTTLKIVTGVLQATSGEVLFDGTPVQRDWTGFKQRLGYVPEEPHLYAHLSGFEYLTMVAQLRSLTASDTRDRINALLRLLSLHENRHAPISAYSKGMQQKVLLIAALLHDPDLILLDEPFSGLDVETSLVLRSLMRGLSARGKVVLFSSHELDTVERLCSHVIILHRGRVVADGSVERLRATLAAETLESVFTQVAVEQDTDALSHEIARVIQR